MQVGYEKLDQYLAAIENNAVHTCGYYGTLTMTLSDLRGRRSYTRNQKIPKHTAYIFL